MGRPSFSKPSGPALPHASDERRMPVNDKTSRVALLLAAFLSGLVLFFGAILVFSKHVPSPIGQAVAGVGGPFHLEDQNGKPVTDQDMKGPPSRVFSASPPFPEFCPPPLF